MRSERFLTVQHTGATVYFFVLLSLFLAAGSSMAAVITVEKDDSGDFIVIQDAVDFAASGDTILIGAGRFDDATEIVTPGWTKPVRVVVPQDTLTIIGVGDGETIIGREEPYQLEVHGYDVGIVSGSYWGSSVILVEGVQFENMETAIVADDNYLMVLRNCRFVGNRNAAFSLSGRRLKLHDCQVDGMSRNGIAVAAWYSESVVMSDCEIELPIDYFMAQQAAYFQGAGSCLIERCSFRNGWGGIGLISNAEFTIVDSIFEGQTRVGLEGSSGSRIYVHGCVFRDLRDGLLLRNSESHLEVLDTEFVDIERASIRFSDLGTGFVRNSHIDPGTVWAVEDMLVSQESYPEPRHFDMRDNWWGTTEADSISAWIFDANDDSTSQYIIDFEPFHDGPVPEEETSFGSFKAGFR